MDSPLLGMAVGKARQMAAESRTYANALEEANATIREANRIIADLRRQVADLELALIVRTAHAEGMKAYRDEFRKAHPNSPVLAPSGQRFKSDGAVKPMGALAYDRAHDQVLRDARISAPEQYRD